MMQCRCESWEGGVESFFLPTTATIGRSLPVGWPGRSPQSSRAHVNVKSRFPTRDSPGWNWTLT